MLVVHRADLHRVLHDAAIAREIDIRLGQRVVQIDDTFHGSFEMATGEVVTSDVLVGADGIHSRTRRAMALHVGLDDKLLYTGDAAYRVTLPKDRLICEPDILELMESRMSARWIGPDGHIMAYPIRGSQMLNLVFVHATPPGKFHEHNFWKQKGSKADMLAFHTQWSPQVRRLIKLADDDIVEWPLYARRRLPCWRVGNVTLVGDASHPMVPYVAQGAAQALEDAAALAVCLSGASNVPTALELYEQIRKERAERIQNCAAGMRTVLHLPEGPDQVKRDEAIRFAHARGTAHPDLWADRSFQDWVWGYDVIEDSRKHLDGIWL
jgi:salicylate hydroxylase